MDFKYALDISPAVLSRIAGHFYLEDTEWRGVVVNMKDKRVYP